MRVLLDEVTPVALKGELEDHEVHGAAELGWGGISNGRLLERAEAAGYRVLLTLDTNMPYQQSLAGRNISSAVLRPGTQGKQSVIDLVPRITQELSRVEPGTVRWIVPETEQSCRP